MVSLTCQNVELAFCFDKMHMSKCHKTNADPVDQRTPTSFPGQKEEHESSIPEDEDGDDVLFMRQQTT